MSILKISKESHNTAEVINSIPLKNIGLLENDVRDLIAEKISDILPDVKLIATEFNGWENSGRRLDILGIDRDKNLVAIEIKRDNDGAHAELQVLRYAAMLSVCSIDTILQVGLQHRRKQESNILFDDYENEILEFLNITNKEDVEFSKIPRIVIVSSNFSKEITTTVMWLNDCLRVNPNFIDISCYELRAYLINENPILHFDQVIPIPKTEEYLVQSLIKENKLSNQIAKQKAEKTWKILENSGILKNGDAIYLIDIEKYKDVPAQQRTAIYRMNGKFEWQGEILSLNALHKEMAELNGISIGSIQAPDYWARENSKLSLAKEAGN